PALGSSRLGDLVDMGCALDHNLYSLAALYFLFASAWFAGRPAASCCVIGCFWHLRVSRCSDGLHVEPSLADPASSAGHSPRKRLGPRPDDGQGPVPLRGGSFGSHDTRPRGSLPPRAAASRIRGVARGN